MCAVQFSEFEGVLEYIEPRTIAEACSLLTQYRGNAKVIAGGTVLVASLKRRQARPEILINLMAINNLDDVTSSGEQGLKIGALVTLYELNKSPVVRGKYPILSQAVHEMLSEVSQRWVYYMATIGGNLCNATSLDIVSALVALGSKAKIQGPKGWRTIPLEEFFTEAGQTILQTDEILIEIEVQNPPPDAGLAYVRRRMEETPVSVATLLKLDSGHTTVEDVRIVLAAPNLIRAHEAEKVIKGESPHERLLKKGAKVASNEVKSGQDGVKNLVSEALLQAADGAVGDFALGY